MGIIENKPFHDNVHDALHNDNLQQALRVMKGGFIEKRRKAREKLPEFDELRNIGRDIRNDVIQNLDAYLTLYEQKVVAAGGHVHWAKDAAAANAAILSICQSKNAKIVTKGKSMVGEEIGINAELEKHNITPVETDLGEYIIQLRHERPSHIIAPALHVLKEEVEDAFKKTHLNLPKDRQLKENQDLIKEARHILREKYLTADVGITGANFLIAETGSSIIVTNEGNGDLTQHLPKTHIVITSIDKIVPTLEDASVLLRLLARSATGQEFSSYTTFSTGKKRQGPNGDDLDGPEEYHVILLDNGRSNLIGSEFQEVLRCIRCGACMNHCPVYAAIGGHAYGGIYPGPIGAVLTPNLSGLKDNYHLPNASSFCGRCEAVCPMHIPLPDLMRKWRMRQFKDNIGEKLPKFYLAIWVFLATRPVLYHALLGVKLKLSAFFKRRDKSILKNIFFLKAWQKYRDMPAPQGNMSFHSLYHQQKDNKNHER